MAVITRYREQRTRPIFPEFDLNFEHPEQNPNGIIAKVCGKEEIKGTNERSEVCLIFYPLYDARDMIHTHATLSDDGRQIIVEEPSLPAFMIADQNSIGRFCKHMGIKDETQKKDWSTYTLGVRTHRPTKKSIYNLPMKCNLDFNEGTQHSKLKSDHKFSIHKVPATRDTNREEKTPIIMWRLGIDGTREPFAPPTVARDKPQGIPSSARALPLP